MAFLVGGANTLTAGYNIDNSCRFDARAHFKRDRASDGTSSDDTTCTFSTWVKPPSNTRDLANQDALFSVDSTGDASYGSIYLTDNSPPDNNRLAVHCAETVCVTNLSIRDSAAWTHIVVALDTGESGTDKCKVYVNGEQITSFATDNRDEDWTIPFTSTGSDFNLATVGNLNYAGGDASYSLEGYLSETYFIDGQQLAASSFGETDESSGIWIPKDYDGSYGTLGFRLEYKENGTSADASGLGADTSGNDFHWTLDSLVATDQTTDTPTNNFATLNGHTVNYALRYHTISEGNLRHKGIDSSADAGAAYSTMAFNTGKWYCEAKVIDVRGTTYPHIGVIPVDYSVEVGAIGQPGYGATDTVAYGPDGRKLLNSSQVSYGDSFTDDDIIGIAIDCDNGAVYFSKNGTFQASGDPTSGASKTNAATTFTPSKYYYFSSGVFETTSIFDYNFGNPPYANSSSVADADGYGAFEYEPPSGYYALCTKNLAKYG